MSDQPQTGPSRAAVITAAALVGALAVGIVVASRLLPESPDNPESGPVGLVPVEAPAAGSPECGALVAALPATLPSGGSTLDRLPIVEPAPVGALAWGDAAGSRVVLRCGLGKPPELTPTAALRQVSGVQWLPIEGDGSATWFAVDRGVYVALTLPSTVGTGPLQTVSEVVGQTLAAQPVRP
ncbi:DUF3515 domain-containing protein [Actinokineospora iranica]|uniref:DUF3515 domain-containing protein n=1 Tax=Actinokineospora iranica TaxID=1271860 RepID=A0A1G6N6A2_9PSEU|nr:DUF3515 domain-containing protein [Actinokineospora iranica]SDC63379.1 Protein of unknown function [Actinokineospora iranica]